MNTPTTTPVANSAPQHTAHELLGNLLKLIDGTHSYQDLTFSRVEGTMKVHLEPDESPDCWWYMEQLTPDWRGVIDFNDYADPGEKQLRFSFQRDVEHPFPGMTDICQLDVDAFEKTILSMGFRLNRRNWADGLWGEYERGDVFVNLRHDGETRTYPLINHNCIGYVSLRFRSYVTGGAR